MKKALFALLLVIVTNTITNAQAFKSYFEHFYKDFNKNPSQTLRQNTTKDYQFVGGDGIWRTSDETASIFDNIQNFEARIENEKIRTYGNTAIVTGTSFMSGVYPDGTKRNYKSAFTYTFVKTKNGWKEASAQHFDYEE
jgi:Domain of unknown function (DUF4440)